MNNLIKTAIIAIFTLFITIENSDANMFNKFKTGFYFEKYKTAEEAKTALLKLHPIGSDVGELVRTLERAKSVYSPITNPKFKDQYNNMIFYKYASFPYEWNIGIVLIDYQSSTPLVKNIGIRRDVMLP